MRIYVNEKTGAEVRSHLAITGEGWKEVTPSPLPTPKQSGGEPAKVTKPKAVSKSGNTVRNKK